MIDLRNISYFSKLSDDEIGVIKKYSVFEEFDAGDVIYYEDEKPVYLFVLIKGSVDLYKTNLKGKQFYIYHINAVDLLGEVAAFSDITYLVTAECATKCTVLKIDYSKTGKFFCDNPYLCRELVKSLYERILSLVNAVDDSSLKTKERVAKYIIQESASFKDKTYTEISKKLNMTPETLSRVLNEFKKRAYIEIDDHHEITFIDEEKLKNLGS